MVINLHSSRNNQFRSVSRSSEKAARSNDVRKKAITIAQIRYDEVLSQGSGCGNEEDTN